MKWHQQSLIFLYGLPAVYYLYHAGMYVFVYIANRNLGHEESFGQAGRSLILAGLLTGCTVLSWYVFNHPQLSKIWTILTWLPLIIVALFLLWMILVLISSGGTWN